MVEKSYGSWDEMSDSYDSGYGSQTSDGVYLDPKTGKYYGIIESRLRTGSSGFLGTKGSKYGSRQRDVYELREDELDAFRALYKKYHGQKYRDDYKEAASKFRRVQYKQTEQGKNWSKTQKKLPGMGKSYSEMPSSGSYADIYESDSKDFFTSPKSSFYSPDEDYEEEFLKTFMGARSSYVEETTAGGRGQRRKAALQRREAAQERYKQGLMSTGWGGGS